jgi:hypothetical protein
MPDALTIKGHAVVFQFPNLERYAIAEEYGLGEEFQETWTKMKKDKAERARVSEVWPDYIKAIVVDPPEFMLDLSQLTAMEALKIVRGFIIAGSEVREN